MEPANAPDPTQTATAIFRSLSAGRLTEKYKAVETLNEPGHAVDFPLLRSLLVKAIAQSFAAGKEVDRKDRSIAETRSWLVGTLARISQGDDEATKVAVKHVSPKHEPYHWARYWALEGLISGKNAEAENVARGLRDNQDDPLVSMLANAFLAAQDDRAAMQRISEGLQDRQTQWSALRALRIVPNAATVPAICQIVGQGEYTDETYDAIMALGSIPNEWSSQSSDAAQALSGFIRKMRGYPWKDSMRSGAINGLGNLKVESSGSLIIEELADDNPAVVREAARSIVKILGLSVTIARVVEAATKSGAMDAYARALRWLNRDAVAEELETLMIAGSPKQREAARTLLSELGGAVAYEKLRARTDAMRQYTDVLEKAEQKVRELFYDSVHEAQHGFNVAIIMDVLVFSVGILLLLVSAGYALFAGGDLSKWAGVGLSGGAGVLGVVYGLLVANPRRQVRESVDHLMRVKLVFLAYLRRLHQADQAYTRRLLDNEPITVDDVKRFADIVGDIMKDTMNQQITSAPAYTQSATTAQGGKRLNGSQPESEAAPPAKVASATVRRTAVRRSGHPHAAG